MVVGPLCSRSLPVARYRSLAPGRLLETFVINQLRAETALMTRKPTRPRPPRPRPRPPRGQPAGTHHLEPETPDRQLARRHSHQRSHRGRQQPDQNASNAPRSGSPTSTTTASESCSTPANPTEASSTPSLPPEIRRARFPSPTGESRSGRSYVINKDNPPIVAMGFRR